MSNEAMPGLLSAMDSVTLAGGQPGTEQADTYRYAFVSRQSGRGIDP